MFNNNPLTHVRHRLESDDMPRHSLMMVTFVILGGFFNYLYQLSMGRMLTPVEYGTLVSLLSFFALVTVLSQSIQISVAKFTSRFKAQGSFRRINYLWSFSLKRTLLLGSAIFVALVLLSPMISRFLNIDNIWYCIVLFSALILAFAISTNTGVLQGLQRFLPFGFSRALLGFLKLSIGFLLVYYLGFGVYGGLLCIPLAILIVSMVSLFFLRDLVGGENEKVELGGLFSYGGLSLLAIASFVMLTNVDVVLVKHYLSPENAGNYAALSVLGRVTLFAPFGVALAMFPKTSDLFETGGSHRRVLLTAIFLTVLLAGGVVIIYWLFPDLVIGFLFGGKHLLAVPYLFKYGLAMALFALSFLLMNYFLSLNQTKVAYSLLGAILLQVVLIVLFHSNIAQIVGIMLLSSVICLALMLLFYLKVRNDISYSARLQ